MIYKQRHEICRGRMQKLTDYLYMYILCYSIANSTLYVMLTSLKFEKTKQKKIQFC